MIQKIKYTGFWFLFFIIFEIITAFIGRGQNIIPIDDFILMFMKCFILTVIVFYKWRKELVYFISALHIFYLFWIGIFLYNLIVYDKVQIIVWYNIILGILGCWAGYLFAKSFHKIAKVLVILFSLALLIFSFKIENYIINFNNYKSFNGKSIKSVARNSFDFLDHNNLPLKMTQERLYVMDFWNTACVYCIKAFPKFNQMIQANKREDIEFLSVNFPLERDSVNQAYTIVKQKGYDFPIYKASSNTRDALGIVGFPTYAAFRNDSIIFMGTIELLGDFLENYKHK